MNVDRSIPAVFSRQLNIKVKLPAKQRHLAASYAAAMDVSATRLANLRTLVRDLTARGRTKKLAAVDLDMSASYLSQLLGGKKMGDDVARKLEAAQGLPYGWMDQAHSSLNEPEAPNSVSQPLRIDPETIAAALRLIRLTYQNLQKVGLVVEDPNNEEDGTAVAFAYEYLFRRGQKAVTVDNVIDFSEILANRLRGTDNDEQRNPTRTRITRSAG